MSDDILASVSDEVLAELFLQIDLLIAGCYGNSIIDSLMLTDYFVKSLSLANMSE